MDVPSLGRNENNDAEHLIKRKVLMTALRYTVKFKKTLLASLIGLSVSQYTFALQEISDAGLSEATGEGIALLPENFSMVFQGANNTASASTDYTDRSKDTGYIRYIPVGPLTSEAVANGAGKADIFLYGLAISKGDGDANNRFGSAISSWGTASNPWLLKVATQSGVENFSTTAGGNNVSYLTLEAPLYSITKPTTGSTGADAYNLKMGFWADAFVRDPTVAENMTATGTQFDMGGANRANRLRLQAIADRFSLNGTNLKVFQTLGGASNSFYNNTVGLAGVVRLNSADTRYGAAGFYYSSSSAAGSSVRNVSITNRYSPTQADLDAMPGASPTAYQRFRLRTIDTTDTITTGSTTVTLPANVPVVRLSTRETTDTGLLATPAINGGSAPTFDANEGLFLYGLNANLVIGSFAQPLIFGKDPSSNNLVFELTRIPNKPELYKQIYTDYSGTDTTYKGSTCNIHQCGSTISVNGTATYQGSSATHSSISIGTTNYTGTTASGGTNLLTADKSAGSFGVSFGALKSQPGTVTTNNYYQLQQQRRDRRNDTQWNYVIDAAGNYNPTQPNGSSCGGSTTTHQCSNFDRAVWVPVTSFTLTSSPTDNIYQQYMPNVSHAANGTLGWGNPAIAGNMATGASCVLLGSSANCQLIPATTADCSTNYINCVPDSSSTSNAVAWGPLPISAQSGFYSYDWTAYSQATKDSKTSQPGALIGYDANGVTKVWYSNTVPTQPAAPAANAASLNNLGSAAIDGMLIQHMKITTKGL
jgi:hypothetical protein